MGVSHPGGAGEPWTGVGCYMGWLRCAAMRLSNQNMTGMLYECDAYNDFRRIIKDAGMKYV